MKKTRTEEIVDALFDLGRDVIVQGIKAMREGRKIVEKAKKVDELIIDADFEDVPAKALPKPRKRHRTTFEAELFPHDMEGRKG